MTKDEALTRAQQVIRANNEALEQPAQEPVGEYQIDGAVKWYTDVMPYKAKLYTHPAPSWQGLSDDELLELIVSKGETSIKYLEFARVIEQALKEKNV